MCPLVAHHSCAIIEAEERGLADVLSYEFEPAPHALSTVLTYGDMTTSPDGEPVPAGRRLAEIYHRYGQGHFVSRSIQRATPMILRAVERAITGPPEAHSYADFRRGQGNACTILIVAGTGSNWLPEWLPRSVR